MNHTTKLSDTAKSTLQEKAGKRQARAESSSIQRPHLKHELRRINLGLALLSVGMVTVLFTILGVLMLRIYTQDNLQLLARSIGYTVEAAMVFDDRIAAQELLTNIVQQEPLGDVTIYRTDGTIFVEWHKPSYSTMDFARDGINTHLLPPLSVDITRGDVPIGRIVLQNDGSSLSLFLFGGLSVALICIAITVIISLMLTRRITRDVAGPLQAMADLVHDVRYKRSTGRRIPRARIAELDMFGEDLNALLAKLAKRQARLLRENESLAMRAKHDSLTGLVNRATFERRLELALRQAYIVGSTYVALLFLDCDNFKDINDTHGHAAGDLTLQVIAQRLRSRVRETDTVTRFGGDEFGILLTALRNADDAMRIADNIVKSMREPIVFMDGNSLIASLTVGIAIFPLHAQDSYSLIRCADLAMYRAKRQKRGSITVIQPEEAAQFNTSGFASLIQ